VFSLLLSEQLSALPIFWRVFFTTACMTPILSYVGVPFISYVLKGWLQPTGKR